MEAMEAMEEGDIWASKTGWLLVTLKNTLCTEGSVDRVRAYWLMDNGRGLAFLAEEHALRWRCPTYPTEECVNQNESN